VKPGQSLGVAQGPAKGQSPFHLGSLWGSAGFRVRPELAVLGGPFRFRPEA